MYIVKNLVTQLTSLNVFNDDIYEANSILELLKN